MSEVERPRENVLRAVPMHPRGLNATDYLDASKRSHQGKPLLGLDDHAGPLTEAHAVLALVQTKTLTPAEARELIAFPESAQRVLADGVPQDVIRRAAEYRAEVLTEFDNLYACTENNLVRCSRRGRRPAVKIMDALLRRTQEPAPARPEDQPGKSMRDVCADSGGLCVECERRVAQRAVGDRALCTVCFYREMTLQSSAG